MSQVQLNFYLQFLVRQAYEERAHSRWAGLSRLIACCNEQEDTVDRRKLKAIAKGNVETPLKIWELEALQRFFLAKGIVTAQQNFLFNQAASLLDSLVDEKAMTLLYPAHYVEDRQVEGCSRWDLQTVNLLNSMPETAHLEKFLSDVYHYKQDETDPVRLLARIRKESWYRQIDNGTALGIIGSPFFNYAAELSLCRAFNIEQPFRKMPADAKRVPFYFVWPDAHRTVDSAFRVDWDQAQALVPDAPARLGPEQRALILGDKLYVADREGESWHIVVAQYQQGHLVLVLSAIFAPGNEAAAECLASREINLRLPYDTGAGDQQPVLIALIKTRITTRLAEENASDQVKRDRRRLIDWQLVSTRLWVEQDRSWEVQPRRGE